MCREAGSAQDTPGSREPRLLISQRQHGQLKMLPHALQQPLGGGHPALSMAFASWLKDLWHVDVTCASFPGGMLARWAANSIALAMWGSPGRLTAISSWEAPSPLGLSPDHVGERLSPREVHTCR